MREKQEVLKTLIADDDTLMHSLLKEMFRNLSRRSRFGFHIKFAPSGMRTIAIASQWVPDILLLDYHMADISALTVMKQLKINKVIQNMLILIMTADSSEETALAGLASGAHDIIYKPIRQTELSLKLANMLALKKKEIEIQRKFEELESEKKIFSRFFSLDIMNKILEDKGMKELGGINTFASMLFLDIRGSTSIAESMEPKRFAEFLNIIFEDFSSIIHRNFGSINKFMGDGILATFGCPVIYNNDSYNCVKAALQIQQSISDFNAVRPSFVKDPVSVGIGIATGKVFAGTVGSTDHMEYTVLGDPVNVAARLQSLSRDTGYNIILESTTYEQLQDVLDIEKLDFSHVRGRIGELGIYGLRGFREDKKAVFETENEKLANIEDVGEVEFF